MIGTFIMGMVVMIIAVIGLGVFAEYPEEWRFWGGWVASFALSLVVAILQMAWARKPKRMATSSTNGKS